MILGVILARGGSKRLPGKNIRPFLGKPLVAWTIEAARKSRLLDRFVVSTDSPAVMAIAEQLDCEVIERPPELASDTASSYDALKHAMQEAGLRNFSDTVVLLQPTSPLRTSEDIDRATWLSAEHAGPIPVASRAIGALVPNGAVYVATAEWLHDGGNWDGPEVWPWFMAPWRSIDIDTLEDFERAEVIARQMAA
jgi:CMP-N,N'-diacetyllegionaminic acid synthase